jgi:hypothetical protein
MVELHLHSPMRLHSVVLNYLRNENENEKGIRREGRDGN